MQCACIPTEFASCRPPFVVGYVKLCPACTHLKCPLGEVELCLHKKKKNNNNNSVFYDLRLRRRIKKNDTKTQKRCQRWQEGRRDSFSSAYRLSSAFKQKKIWPGCKQTKEIFPFYSPKKIFGQQCNTCMNIFIFFAMISTKTLSLCF